MKDALTRRVNKIAKAYYKLTDEIEDYLKGDIHNTESWDEDLKKMLDDLYHRGGLFEP